jgi:hypothetical protein
MPDRSFDDTALIVSELVAEAALAARTEPHGDVGVRVEAAAGAVRVEVHEGEFAYRMASGVPKPGERGFGLRVAQAIADRWAVSHDHGHPAVLVEIHPPDA